MSVALTPKAVAQVKATIEASRESLPANPFLRVEAAAGGCSGFSYRLTFDDRYDEQQDQAYEYEGLRVVVDRKSELVLEGTTIDYYDGIERQGFVFNNPNAVKTCGCGSSFQV